MKLTKSQKFERKELREYHFDNNGYFDVQEGHTFAIIPKGNTVIISCAILNPCDIYNRKYGEWLALTRMYNEGDNIVLPSSLVYE
jgi:hypothetical protein